MSGQLAVTKEFKWDMAHMLSGHNGLCKNLHGHTYKMEVTVSLQSSNPVRTNPAEVNGMIVDFKELKQIVERVIVEPLDHSFMYWLYTEDEVERQIAKTLIDSSRKVFAVPYRPTAENMAMSFLHRLNNALTQCEATYTVCRIKLWENPTSYATART